MQPFLLLLVRVRPPYRTRRKFPNPCTGRGKHFTHLVSAYSTLQLRMLLSNFSSDHCEQFGPGCEWSFPGDLAQEHYISICLPKDLCRDVKRNQKQKNLVVLMHMILITNSMYTLVFP